MAIIDSQVHTYERNTPARPWAGFLHGPEEATGDQMVAAMDAVGVDGAVLVSPFAMYRFDASYALQVHKQHPGRFGLVKPVDPSDPAVAETIADWKQTPGTIGIRVMLNRGMPEDPADPGINRVLAAAAKHDLRKPEGKVAAANGVLPYLVKVPNPLLRAELAGRLAERLRLDERLLRDELRRAASEGRGEVRVREEVAATQANHAVKQLLRLCLESEEIAEAVLPDLIASGAVQGLAGEGVFTRLWEARQRGEKLDVTNTEVELSDGDRKLALEALFWPGDPPKLEVAEGALRSLKVDKLEKELKRVQNDIERSTREGDSAQLLSLNTAKLKIKKELLEMARPQKNSTASGRN